MYKGGWVIGGVNRRFGSSLLKAPAGSAGRYVIPCRIATR